MTLPDIVAIVAILLVVGAAVFYIIRAKKQGKRCIGCPDESSCSGNCSSCCHCVEKAKTQEK